MGDLNETLTSHFLDLRAKLHRAAMGILHNTMDAEDAVQEAYVRLSVVGLPATSKAEAYGKLYRAVRNNCIDTLRQRSRYSTAPLAAKGQEPHYDETELMLGILLKRLSPVQRQVMEMASRDGMDCAEIADALGMTTEAVRKNLQRARHKVRQAYTQLNK